MLYQFKKFLLPSLFGMFLSFPISLSAATDFNLADVPLSVISSVEPNVMLLLDNSGSMNNIVWYQGRETNAPADYIPPYNSLTDYDDWYNGGRWTDSTYMTLASINNGGNNQDGTCATQNTIASVTVSVTETVNGLLTDVSYTVPRYVIQGQDDSGILHCLILPDILNNGRTRYTGNYLNYLFQYFADGDDLTTIIPFKTRLMVMKDVTTELVSTTSGMRFGLMSFDPSDGDDGGLLQTACDIPNSSKNVITNIDKLNASTLTPLAEAMYEVTRYFRGMEPYYTKGDKFSSPIQYSCQKNFTITITDGLPTYDRKFDTNDPAITTYCPGSGSCELPNWDGIVDGDRVDFRFKDGSGGNNEGESLYYDDIVKFAYDVDMKTGDGFDDAPFDKQNIETYTVGFSIENQMLRDAGHYGSGRTSDQDEDEPPTNYFTADDESQLRYNLEEALMRIEGKSGSAASVAASTGFIGAGTALYQALYETDNWTGNLKRHELTIAIDKTVTITDSGVDAATKLLTKLSISGAAANRNIISYDPVLAQGIDFNWSSLTTTQKSDLANREEILDFIRGDQSCEIDRVGTTCASPKIQDLRNRGSNGEGLLGTIINSTPIYIAKPLEYYPSIWNSSNAPENVEGVEKYYDFKTSASMKERQPLVYVGANDGMLHVFDATTMEEVMAYIPNAVYPQLGDFADQSVNHRYFVDGTPTIIDAFFGGVDGDNKWHTVLVGGLNKGGQGIYALDITNPNSFTGSNAKNNVLWEFTHNDDRDLGYTYSRPAIIRMHNGEWAAVFGNGYNNTEIDEGDTNADSIVDIEDDTGKNDSETGNAVLYFVNLKTGELIHKIDTGFGTAEDPLKKNRPNGLSTIAPIDIDNDYIVDYIYAGDLFGNLWRFDVTGASAGAWKILSKDTSSSEPIFVAVDSGGTPQPITSSPDVTITDAGGMMIYFGTGQYLQLTDIQDKSIQTFYGLLDNPINDKLATSSPVPVVRAKMIQQTIMSEDTYSGKVTERVRQFSKAASTGNYASWYIDLLVDGSSPEGERVIGSPIVRGITKKKIVFTSIVPTQDVCDFGGRSWLIELDARNGNLTTSPVFDLNFDGKLDKFDNGNGTDVYNGWSQGGIQTTPSILKDTIEYKILSGSTGTLRAVGEAPDAERDGERHSWRQIK